MIIAPQNILEWENDCFFYKGSAEISGIFLPSVPAEQHVLQGYNVCEKAVNQNGAQLLLLEQTFSVNLKSLITPSLNKVSGVIFFFFFSVNRFKHMPESCAVANTWENWHLNILSSED